MIESIDTSMVDWARAQFALTAMYHWLFVPLTLGLSVVIGIMESIYVYTGNEFWKRTVKFWMKLFGINFAIGVATGIILEFQFGTNWSNYSWFVGDIFGAPLAIEGMLAFFMESTFIAVMFFGWEKVSKRFHLIATWMTGIGATISAWWILVANAWMQNPVAMQFNPETMRNEMVDFLAVAFSPFAVAKFFHTVLSSWMLGATFVIGISAYYLIRKREREFALKSIKIASITGLIGAILTVITGDMSAYQVGKTQPMKLAVMEGLYDGGKGTGFSIVPGVEVPYALSFLATRDFDGYVPGVNNLLHGGFVQENGETALSADEKIQRGKMAITALADFRKAKAENNPVQQEAARAVLDENMKYFGYGYIKDKAELVPNVNLVFWSFRIMIGLGGLLSLVYIVMLYRTKKDIHEEGETWLNKFLFWCWPLGFIASQAGWVVAEVGRQPWTVQDMLPVGASISRLSTGSVQTTFFLFAVLFLVLAIAEIGIMVKAIKKGPEDLH